MNNMIESTKNTSYEVHCFVNGDGVQVSNKKGAKIMLASATSGDMRGFTVPFGIKVARQLKLKVGDSFVEEITLKKVSAK